MSLLSNNRGLAQLQQSGFTIIPGVADTQGVEDLLQNIASMEEGQNVRRRGSVYGVRNLLDAVPAIHTLARSAAVRSLVEPVLGPGAFPVRGILFDKTPEANWNVVWHQDLSIAVRERRDAAGFGPWSEKAGVTHVQPPASLLERMLTLRLHLDDCAEDNGPLRVIPSSHLSGRLDTEEIHHWRECTADVACLVPLGGALLMRPLLLHASSAAKAPRHRRVVHLEFAAEGLPDGLQWHRGQTLSEEKS